MNKKLIQKPYDWNKCMMNMAFEISKMSKDPRSKIGAVLVSKDKRQISIGYNGFPSLIPDVKEWWENRNDDKDIEFMKYDLVNHAEYNAIAQCPFDIIGSSLYVTVRPCLDCALKIVTEKISKVYYANEITNVNGMDLKAKKVEKLFKIAGIELIKCQ